MDKVREEFEAWATSAGYITKMITQIAGEVSEGIAIYANGQTRSAWQAWQASRKALVVELPDFFVSGIDAAVYRDDVIEALDEAGVSYK